MRIRACRVLLTCLGLTLLAPACASLDESDGASALGAEPVQATSQPGVSDAPALVEPRAPAETRAPEVDDSGPTEAPESSLREDEEAPENRSPSATRAVLLIPGTTITGDFFDEMAARLSADGFDPVVYEPPDLLTESLALGAERIGDVVRELLEERGEGRLHIVAECNGGVATRYWLQILGGHAQVDQVVTFVSAHHGTWTSPLGEWVTGFDSLEDITPGSAFLELLEAAPFPEGLHLTSIYTCWDEVLWPWDTSYVEGATNVLFCDYYLGHFDGFWDPVVYDRILQALRGEGDDAPTYY